ncbi:MAG: response regulator transcription factor [Herpetosiphonaceae bacterium]|nr:response regulator transcription factor [Herpetosiphonaceae bacterium]
MIVKEPEIMVVEDDTRARMLLVEILRAAGYHATMAANGEQALELLEQQQFDVVITDIRLGAVDGVQVLYAARGQPQPPAVILLTGYGSLDSAISALRVGACDYLMKPVEPPEMLQCVARAVEQQRVIQRQTRALQAIAEGFALLNDPEPPNTTTVVNDRYLEVGNLRLDRFRHMATFNEQPLHLTPTEYALLYCLAASQGRVLSYCEIVRRTHGHDVNETEAQLLLKAHLRNLRRKIDPAYLVNVRGAGYMLVAPGEQ